MKKIIFSLLVAMVATVWNTNAQVQTGESPALTAIFSENFESMTANATPTGWSISGSTVPKMSDRPDYVWGEYQYQGGNKTIRMYNAAGSMNGHALIKSPSIQLPATGPCQLKFKYSHRANCGNFIVKISTNNGSTFTDLCSVASSGSYDKFNHGTMTEKTIDLASYLGQTAIIQFYAYANESQGSIFVDDVRVLGQASAPEFSYTLSENVDESYSGEAKSVSVTVTTPSTGVTVQYSTNKGTTWADGSSVSRTNVGTDSVIFKLSAAGYTDTITNTVVLKVNATNISGTLSIEPVSNQTYTGDSIKPDINARYDVITLVKGTDYTLTYSNNVNVGTATATLTGIGNFTGSDGTTFTIDPASISDATIAEIPDATYTGSEIKPALTITFNGDTLVENTDYTVEYSDNVNVGTATATATGIGNFTGTASKNFTIAPAPVTEPTITDIEVSGRKFAGNELTFTAKFAGFSGEPTVVYQVNGEEQPGNTFTPPSASVYTVRAEAKYGDDEYAEKEVDVLVQEKEPVVTYDTTMFVAGNFTNWQAGMRKLPYTVEFPIDSTIQFKQVRRIIKFEDEVAVDTALTWYGNTSYGDYMTEENPSRKLEIGGDYNVCIMTDPEGEYTFYYNADNEHFEVGWPGKPAPVAKVYAKNNWDGEEWTWKEMTKDPESTIYTLDKVVFGGTGIYINDRESALDVLWYDLKTMHYIGGADSIRVNDTVNLVFNIADSILVAEFVAHPTSPVSVTVGTSGYATIVTPNNLTVPSGVEVYGYTFDDLSEFMVPGDAIKAGEILPSGKGYVVKASPGEYTFTGTSAAAGTTAKFESDLTGWTTDKAASQAGGTVYGLGIVGGKVGFYKFSGDTISAGKAVYVKSN